MNRLATDLDALTRRESEQVEWKEGVADVEDVVKTIAAFANDLQNLGGGFVVCGAKESRDDAGFQKFEARGLDAAEQQRVEKETLAFCRDYCSPPIVPLIEILPAATPERKLLVFVVPATAHVHEFRCRDKSVRVFVRISRETREARNGLLLGLMAQKGRAEPWDRRLCTGATVDDLDLLVLRDTLARMGAPTDDVPRLLDPSVALSALVPPLCGMSGLDRTVRPRNFAVLLFGREPTRFIPGAFATFSDYPGTDRSDPFAERHDLVGGVVEQARRLIDLLEARSYMAFDKTDAAAPNAVAYPRRALYEAAVNALVHRDYELVDPTRVTVFSDRIEFYSPGALPMGVDPDAVRAGKSGPKWRNQALAWFFGKLQLAQFEGQGIPTILSSMRTDGCPLPQFDFGPERVVCVLPAHPRHAANAALRLARTLLAADDLARGADVVQNVLDKNPRHEVAIGVLIDAAKALGDASRLRSFVERFHRELQSVPVGTVTALVRAIVDLGSVATGDLHGLKELLESRNRGIDAEQRLAHDLVASIGGGDLDAIVRKIDEAAGGGLPLPMNPRFRMVRASALCSLGLRCAKTSRQFDLPESVRSAARAEALKHIAAAEAELRHALQTELSPELYKDFADFLALIEVLRKGLGF